MMDEKWLMGNDKEEEYIGNDGWGIIENNGWGIIDVEKIMWNDGQKIMNWGIMDG